MMKRKKLLLFSLMLVLVFSAPAQAQLWSGILDPSRAIDWSQAGAGVIPDRTTICSTLNPGATLTSINNAIANCPEGQVVFLSAGTYGPYSGNIIFNNKSNVTLRGDGPDSTILEFSNSGSSCIATSHICLQNASPVHDQSSNILIGTGINQANWTAGYTRGTTVVTLDNTTGLVVNSLLFLDQDNDICADGDVQPEIWVTQGVANNCTQEGGAGTRRAADGSNWRAQVRVVKVTAINGNSITIEPGLYYSNWRAARNPGAWWSPAEYITGVGLEDFTIDFSASGSAQSIVFYHTYKCWMKNVRTVIDGTGTAGQTRHIFISLATNNTFRDSYFYGVRSAVSTNYGIEFVAASDTLVENNISEKITGFSMQGLSAVGNTFGYNFSINNVFTPADTQQCTFCYHNPGVALSLFEGNNAQGFFADIVHGTSNLATSFRNRFFGRDAGRTNQTPVFIIRAGNRAMNFIGNVLGEDGYHTFYERVPPANGNQSLTIFDFSNGIGSIPDDSYGLTTMYRWGNYDTVNDAVRFVSAEVPSGLAKYANAEPSDQNLPASFYLNAKPSWWPSGTPWPPIGPDVTGGDIPNLAGHAYSIPAKTCYDGLSLDPAFDPEPVRIFDARNCYGNTSPRPASPTNLGVVVR